MQTVFEQLEIFRSMLGLSGEHAVLTGTEKVTLFLKMSAYLYFDGDIPENNRLQHSPNVSCAD